MIGIIGINGKIIIKELIFVVLLKFYNVFYIEGNLNNYIGVFMILFCLKVEYELVVIEMGVNYFGEIKFLVYIVELDYGMIINVGKVYLEGFGFFEGVICIKGELYDYFCEKEDFIVFIYYDNVYLMDIVYGLNLIFYGSEDVFYVNGYVIGNFFYLIFEWKVGKDGDLYKV